MRRTLVWPPALAGGGLRMTPDPRTATTSGAPLDQALRQLVALAVQDGRSQNPFAPPLGVDPPAFAPASTAAATAIRAAVEARFRGLERSRRARLLDCVVGRPREVGALAVQSIRVVYEDLETGARQDMEVSVNG